MRSAVVVGAGVAGLAAAGALARTGWQVTLLERADRLRAGRAAVLLWPDGVRALRALGLSSGLDAIASPVLPAGLRRCDGRWLVQPAAVGDRDTPVVVHEADLHDSLVAGLGDRVEVRTGVTAVAVPGAGTPTVRAGRLSWAADLVVAADGAASALRAQVAPGSTAVSAGTAAWRAVVPWYRSPRPRGDVPPGGETLGGAYRFRYVSLGERGSAGASSRGGVYWVATAPGAPRPEPPAVQLGLLRRWFAGWHPPVPDLLAATEPEDLVSGAVTELRPVPRRFAATGGPGGYVLLGDAAHAMSHHLAVGACLAIEDAATLGALLRDALPGPALVAALEAYGRARRPRAVRMARRAHRVGLVVQARGRLVVRARDTALGAVSPRLVHRALAGPS